MEVLGLAIIIKELEKILVLRCGPVVYPRADNQYSKNAGVAKKRIPSNLKGIVFIEGGIPIEHLSCIGIRRTHQQCL